MDYKVISMRFYTNFFNKGNTVFIRGYADGNRFTQKIKYKPTLYVPSKKQDTEYKNIFGEPVEPIEFTSISEARDFYKQYDEVSGFTIYGSNLYAYACLNENYGTSFDVDTIKTAYLDIEVNSEEGFPEPLKADAPVTVITVGVQGRHFVFGIGEYTAPDNKVRYLNFATEKQLLLAFLKFWRQIDADVVSGWNVKGFDIPYLYNRIMKVVGEEQAKALSPVNLISERKYTQFNKEQIDYDLVGLSVLDYLELYKKFTYSQQESYRLDHIAFVELGERKLDYHELGFETLNEFYKGDYQNYVAYNIRDVALVERLEDKMRLIEQAMVIAYDAKVNFGDVFTQVRMWDVLIHNYLMTSKVVIPPKTFSSKDTQYAGAYVKDPQVGLHNWVMSFDLNSLYPHLIMQYNISPETFVEGEYVDININKVISGEQTPAHNELCVSANGYMYRKDIQGFLPEMMQRMYDERVIYKKKMLEAQQEQQDFEREMKKRGIKF
jgi:DNA polymerase elongation subunit (family B)